MTDLDRFLYLFLMIVLPMFLFWSVKHEKGMRDVSNAVLQACR